MKKTRALGIITGICLLFCGCGADNENEDIFLQQQTEDIAAESVSENTAETSISEEDLEEPTLGTIRAQWEAEKLVEKMVEEQKKLKYYGTFLAEYITWKKELDERAAGQFAKMVQEQSKVLERYDIFLTEYAARGKGRDSGQVPGFALIYLDGDDIPELVLIDGYAHAHGGLVYTFEEGRVVPVGEYGQYGTMHYQEKEGIVFDDYDTFGDIFSEGYQIEGSRATLLQSYSEYCMLPAVEDKLQYTYTVDGKEVSKEQYLEVSEKWLEAEYSEINYDMCRTLAEDNIQEGLREELENLIFRQEEALKQGMLLAAEEKEEDILLWDYDDFDGDGNWEAFMIVGRTFNVYGSLEYTGTLYFAGADGSVLTLDDSYGSYRLIDGKMDFGSRKYLYFYTDYCFTANVSEIWTVRDGKPVEESGLYQSGQVVYRGENERNEFEIWVDGYNHFYGMMIPDAWTGHTYRPYFYYYDSDSDQIKAFGGKLISEEDFEELSATNIIEEIKAKGYTVGDIIRWDNNIVTINYNYVQVGSTNDSSKWDVYENVIWDNNVKDFWRKEAMQVTSWENAGVGGSYGL